MNTAMPDASRHPRPVQRARAGLAMLAVLLTGCTGSAADAGRGGPDSAAETAIAPPAAVSFPIDLARAGVITPLRDVLASRSLVGRRVKVTGRCLAAQRESLIGKPPRASSEWQLASDGVYVYVTGPLPPGCSRSSLTTVTIVAVVAEDTLPAIGDLPPAPRRFLVYGGGAEP